MVRDSWIEKDRYMRWSLGGRSSRKEVMNIVAAAGVGSSYYEMLVWARVNSN